VTKDQEACAGEAGSDEVTANLEHGFEGKPEGEMKLRRYFDASRDMRFVVSGGGRLIELNQAGVELFGYPSKGSMFRLDSFDCLCVDREAFALLLQRVRDEGFVKDHEMIVKRYDGSLFCAWVTAHLWLEEDGTFSYKGILQDVTECWECHEALLASQRHNQELTESEKRMRELNQHILHLLMVLSHDIRGPLVAVAATVKLLLRGSYGNMDESVRNTVLDLETRVKRLVGIVEDYLGKAHSLEGDLKIEREMLDLRQDIIDPVLDELANEIQQRDIMIDNRLGAIPAGQIPVNVNKIWLKMVFRNLFTNAIKYGGKGCRIAFGFEDHGSHYRLNVYNSGIPVPFEKRDKLFTQFFRAESGDRGNLEGVGLGLYLTREIIRQHGGDIWYEAKHDGSDFIFTISKEGS
jgi:PAS domain S-box-containing protein